MKRLMLSAAALLIAAPALAADMGGSCCADLEERIAELEATTARKGTRKMSVTISGQINKALLWHDIDGLGGADKARMVSNGNAPSAIRIDGMAKMDKFTAGFIYEFGIDETAGKLLHPVVGMLVDDIQLRHAAVWLGTPMGKITLGQTSTATDAITEITTANTAVASRMLSLDPLWTYSGIPGLGLGFINPLGYDGGRAQVVRYDTPTLAGFTGSASWGGGEAFGGFVDRDVWDVAARYAGEFAGFRIAGGVGYRVEKMDTTLAIGMDDVKTLSGSASAMHMSTGLFLTLAAADQKNGLLFGDSQMWQAQAGIERNVFGIGATTAYVEYGQLKIDGSDADPNLMGAGLVQKIDGLSADVYASWRRYDLDSGSDAKADVFMGGMRIKF